MIHRDGIHANSSVGCAASGGVVVVVRQKASRAPDRRMLGKEVYYVKENSGHDNCDSCRADACSFAIGHERAYDLREVIQIGGCQTFMDRDKECLFAVENAGFDTMLLDESF